MAAALVACAPVVSGSTAVCSLGHATYEESVSGAMIQFRPKDGLNDPALMVARFEMHLPQIAEAFPGDITWNAGSNARPDGAISRKCRADETSDESVCWLWTGNAFALGENTASLIDKDDVPAPKAILLSDFGRLLTGTETFVRANPSRGAFDVFRLTGCAP